eukprot:CAMPEP_0182845082 /NCGR_PEP_ID=MMETSP0006_2-20121128/27126_1 /TAXON_ID=97485 /ORGANISM="Prymnesium parvum, Strain Texoma1" /LENGTH=59 /DNA_ID=CAMNT_0024975107 /DNA_START=271 /DNA_END=447 /DNA_ORIENTATION=-
MLHGMRTSTVALDARKVVSATVHGLLVVAATQRNRLRLWKAAAVRPHSGYGGQIPKMGE